MDGFSWKRGLKHAGLAGLLVLVAGIALVVAFPVKNPEKVGEGTGQFAVFVMALGLGASYFAQTGRKVAAIAMSVVTVGLVVAMVVVVVLGVHSQPKLTASMRAPLLDTDEGGEKWLEQVGLGFKIHHPGPAFKEAPMYAESMRASDPGDDIIYHAYADAEPSAVLVVAVMARELDSRAELDKTLAGIERGLRDSAAKQMPGIDVHMLERAVTDRDAKLHFSVGPAHFRMHMFSFPDGHHPYAVMLLVMSQSPDALAAVLSELKR